MCGIVGYTGPRAAGPILLEGLRRLEYRGYDSAGIALVTESGELFVEKRAGKLANLRTALLDRTPNAGIGLAHTRWATHGRPNDLNAHPHVDCTGSITVIHNGIIENFRELRDGLEARGHVLTSETDTEALAHLVEEAYAGDLADAVRAALARVEGAYAVAVMHRGEPDRPRGARQNVPLVVGLGDDEAFIASDVAAILAHTNRVIFLEEGDVVDVRPTRVTDHRRRRIAARAARHAGWTGPPRPPRRAASTTSCSRRSTSSHRRSASASRAGWGQGATIRTDELAGMAPLLADVDRVEFVACGSASYAALVGAAAVQEWTGLPARVTVGSEFRYSPPPLDARTLVIAVTQSGETADTIAPTRFAREQGCPIIAVTNTVGSAITREADAVLFLQAGPEVAVAASKTFTTQVLTLVLVAAQIARLRGTLDGDVEATLVHALRALPDAAQRALDAARRDRPDRPAIRQLAGLHVRRAGVHLPDRHGGRAEAQGGQLPARRGLRGR